jgi:hypothetical protein
LKQPIIIPHTFAGWTEWIVIAISGFVAQYLLTAGLQIERAGRGMSMVYLQMVFAFAFERYFLKAVISNGNRFIWGIIPDFWSISGSGLILGGAVWVAVAKSRVNHERQDDLEANEYVAVNSEERSGKETEFELGYFSDHEEEQVGSSSSSPRTPSKERWSEDITGEDEDLKDGELSEVINWKDDRRDRSLDSNDIVH